jgi:hypothetical protein
LTRVRVVAGCARTGGSDVRRQRSDTPRRPSGCSCRSCGSTASKPRPSGLRCPPSHALVSDTASLPRLYPDRLWSPASPGRSPGGRPPRRPLPEATSRNPRATDVSLTTPVALDSHALDLDVSVLTH